VPIILSSAALAGVGRASATGSVIPSSATLSGDGALSATDSQIYAPAATLAGSGVLAGSGIANYKFSPALAGTGTLSATAAAVIPVAVIGTPTLVGANNVAIPAHAVGDLIILTAISSQLTIPIPTASGTVPAWVALDFSTTTLSMRTVYFKATATNHTSGVWTNVTAMTATVIRNQNASTPIGGHALGVGSSTNSPNAPAVTLTQNDGTSLLLHIYVHASFGGTAWSAVPAGYTRVVSTTTGTYYQCINRKTSSTSDGAIIQGDDGTVSSVYRTTTIEILK
jgi:hypothetical protein